MTQKNPVLVSEVKILDPIRVHRRELVLACQLAQQVGLIPDRLYMLPVVDVGDIFLLAIQMLNQLLFRHRTHMPHQFLPLVTVDQDGGQT